MVVIRLARGGAKKRPFYNVVVTDSRSRRDGRFIERVGFYNPIARRRRGRPSPIAPTASATGRSAARSCPTPSRGSSSGADPRPRQQPRPQRLRQRRAGSLSDQRRRKPRLVVVMGASPPRTACRGWIKVLPLTESPDRRCSRTRVVAATGDGRGADGSVASLEARAARRRGWSRSVEGSTIAKRRRRSRAPRSACRARRCPPRATTRCTWSDLVGLDGASIGRASTLGRVAAVQESARIRCCASCGEDRRGEASGL